MARSKKPILEEEDVKPKRKYTKHLSEQLRLNSYITEGIIPFIEVNIEKIEQITTSYLVDRTISKDDWSFLYNIADHLCDIAGDQALIAFNRRYLSGKYTKSAHSTFYMVQTMDYAKYILNHINRSKTYNKEDDKTFKFYQGSLYLVAEHLFFFVNVKERLGLTN